MRRTIGQFTVTVRTTSVGRWAWSVELPGDEGDSDVCDSYDEAVIAAEGALDLIVDELFLDIEMAYI